MYTNASKQLKQNTNVVMDSCQTSGLSVTNFNIKEDISNCVSTTRIYACL